MDKGHAIQAIGFAVILLLMVLLTNHAMDRVEELNLQLQKVVKEYHHKSSLLTNMQRTSRERIFALHHMLLIDDPFIQDDDAMLMDEYASQFIIDRQELASLNLTPKERKLLEKQGELAHYSVPLQREAIAHITSGDIATARRMLIDMIIPSQHKVMTTLSELESVQAEAIEEIVIQAQQQQSKARKDFILMGGAALLLGLFIFFLSLYLARRLTYQAHHDPLTGICNRRGFECYLNKLLQRPSGKRDGHLCLMDLDHFKQVNDNGGHAAGDALLKELVRNISNTIRRNDIFARMGGDEFALILEGCPLSNAQRIALEIRDTVRDNRFTWQGQEYRVGISIGMVTLDSDTYSTAELLALADDACYSAKEGGRNQVHYYTENTDGVQFVEVKEPVVTEQDELSGAS